MSMDVINRNELAEICVIEDPVYLVIRPGNPNDASLPAFGLAVKERRKSFLLKDQYHQVVEVEIEEISRPEFWSWAKMKVLPVFMGYQRKGVAIQSATVTHRCHIDYPFNPAKPIAHRL